MMDRVNAGSTGTEAEDVFIKTEENNELSIDTFKI